MMCDPIMAKLDEAIAASPVGWAITDDERNRLYDALVRHVEQHRDIPEVFIEVKGRVIE